MALEEGCFKIKAYNQGFYQAVYLTDASHYKKSQVARKHEKEGDK